MRIFQQALLWAAFFSFFGALSRAELIPSYIDRLRGVVIARGEAEGTPGASHAQLRSLAIEDARRNVTIVLERESLTDRETIGEHLSAYPEKRQVLRLFVESATIINQNVAADGKVEVTISLPIGGEGGLDSVKGWLRGERTGPPGFQAFAGGTEGEPFRTGALAPSRKEKLKKTREPKRLVFMTLENRTGFEGIDAGEEFTRRLKERFRRDRRFVILPPEESAKALEESDMTVEELMNSDVTDRVRVRGADGVIVGAVSKYESKVNKIGPGGLGYLEVWFNAAVDMRILDAAAKRWVFYEEIPVSLKDTTFTLKSADDADKFIQMTSLDSERGLAARAFNELIAKAEKVVRTSFPLEGYVLRTLGDRVYINLTVADGVREDDVLTVYRIGETLVDPVTGEEIDEIRDIIGTIRVTAVWDTYSQAAVEEIGRMIVEGDVVTLR
ncbi:MAG: hypothetical protein AB1742_16265 [bacterium]